jgi:hypothetical protein
MGDPRNPARVKELWDPHRLKVMDLEIMTLTPKAALSGGWAWHYMSPRPHDEYKLLHDHKDIDLFIEPYMAGEFIGDLKRMGYKKTTTIYDNPSGQFIRYQKHVQGVKIIIDLFMEKVPTTTVFNAVRVVKPETLLSFYSLKKHTTDDCVAVQAARKLIEKGIDPIGREELCLLPS